MSSTQTIKGKHSHALVLNADTAYVLQAVCLGCGEITFYEFEDVWTDDPDLATVFRTYEAGMVILERTRAATPELNAILDIVPLFGLVRK